jgi:hypothetical protein
MASWLAQPGGARPGRSLALVLPGGTAVGFALPATGDGSEPDADRILGALRFILNPASS